MDKNAKMDPSNDVEQTQSASRELQEHQTTTTVGINSLQVCVFLQIRQLKPIPLLKTVTSFSFFSVDCPLVFQMMAK